MTRACTIRIVVLTVLPACGWVQGMFGDPPTANRQACEAYVAHMNTLEPCMNITYDVDNLCAGTDDEPVDMAPYYQCLRDNSRCEGTEPVLSLDGCAPPSVPIDG